MAVQPVAIFAKLYSMHHISCTIQNTNTVNEVAHLFGTHRSASIRVCVVGGRWYCTCTQDRYLICIDRACNWLKNLQIRVVYG